MGLADYIKSRLPYWPNWFNLILLKCNCFGSLVFGLQYHNMLRNIDNINPEQRLMDTVNYALEHVPYYRNRYGNLRINSISDFEKKIGFIDKNEVITHWNEFLSDECDAHKMCYGTTGGSSGKPMKLAYPENRYVYSMSFVHRIWLRFGWRYETRGVFRNHQIEQGRDYVINPIMKEVIFDTFRMNEKYAVRCWKILRRYNIKYIHAYPSAFFQFCRLCYNQRMDLSFIKTVFLASEGITSEQNALFSKFNLNICTFYGHSECLILAGNSPDSALLRIEEHYGYCELVDENENVITSANVSGELVGTTFFNRMFPLIRYKTHDHSMYVNNPDEADKSRYLSSVQGHWDKSIIYKIDNTYTTTAALNLHGDINSHIDGLQYIQEKKGYLTVCIVKNESFSDENERYLLDFYSKAMGGAEYVEIRYVEQLYFGANHKFAQLISSINVAK